MKLAYTQVLGTCALKRRRGSTPLSGTHMKKIGIVGLGIMGRGMANNFLKHHYPLFVWNRTTTISKEFENKGATICSTPADVARNSDIVFEITANDSSSKSVWTGKDGILAGANKSKVLIASATLSIGWINKLITLCNKSNFNFLDIALTGSRVGAETGTLTLLCGGDKAVLDDIKPDLNAIATKILYFGPHSHGMKYKLILNYLQAVHIIGFAQAMKIAKNFNMVLEKVSDALSDRPGGVITEIARKTYFNEPDPVSFSIEWITKDLTYAKKLAKNIDVKLLDEVLKQYKKAVSKGYAKKDWARISRLME